MVHNFADLPPFFIPVSSSISVEFIYSLIVTVGFDKFCVIVPLYRNFSYIYYFLQFMYYGIFPWCTFFESCYGGFFSFHTFPLLHYFVRIMTCINCVLVNYLISLHYFSVFGSDVICLVFGVR